MVNMGVDMKVFFFSSRRRHTRLRRDWSSDVCSSDLIVEIVTMIALMIVKKIALAYGAVMLL